jgi:hypothetical protein
MKTGRPREALASIEIGDLPLGAAWQAMALAQIGNVDASLKHLDRALAGGYRDFADLRTSPYFSPLRGDPRWAALLAQYGAAP